jgi:hypothetical protein
LTTGLGRAAAVLAVSTLLATAACGGDDPSMTYSVSEVLAAFSSAGYPLVEDPPPAGTSAADEGTYLFPQGGRSLADAPLAVVVATDQAAEEAWPGYVSVGGDEDSLTIRRANVVAISDGAGLTGGNRARIRQAMEALPDRGHAVDVLEER